MKVLAIVGSPNLSGSTSTLTKEVIHGLETINSKIYFLGEENLSYCKGCKSCYKAGVCVIHDSMDLIIKDYIDADLVIIATPDYWGDVSGQMKVFFDRCTPYANTNSNRKDLSRKRLGVGISVREGKTDRENNIILASIEHFFGHMEIEPVGTIAATQVSSVKDLSDEKIKEAYNLGKSIKEKYFFND